MQKVQQYGTVGIITHLTLSWSFFAITYLVVSRTKNVSKIIKYLKLQNKIPAKAKSFLISGIIYKAVMPVRIGASLLCTPLVIKALDINMDKKEEPISQIDSLSPEGQTN